MPRTVKDGGQGHFEDKPLSVPADVLEAFEIFLENRDAATAARKAKVAIKEAIPQVEEPTRFIIDERYFVTASPYERDGHEVSGGRGQRLKISDTP